MYMCAQQSTERVGASKAAASNGEFAFDMLLLLLYGLYFGVLNGSILYVAYRRSFAAPQAFTS